MGSDRADAVSTAQDDDRLGRVLLALARAAVARHLGRPAAKSVVASSDERLGAPGATFVTLRSASDGALRGCLGTLEPCRSLREDVEENAVSAATRDPRFTPLEAGELDGVRFEVSLLGVPSRLPASSSEREIRSRLRPGVDGVLLEWQGRRATFLPQVWRQLPEPSRLLDELKRKAGLPIGFWDDDVEVSTYAVRKWTEGAGVRRPP